MLTADMDERHSNKRKVHQEMVGNNVLVAVKFQRTVRLLDGVLQSVQL